MINGTARSLDDSLRSRNGDEPGVQKELRIIAQRYMNVTFVDTERPAVSIELLTKKAEEVGMTNDVEVRAAIEELQSIRKIGWD